MAAWDTAQPGDVIDVTINSDDELDPTRGMVVRTLGGDLAVMFSIPIVATIDGDERTFPGLTPWASPDHAGLIATWTPIPTN